MLQLGPRGPIVTVHRHLVVMVAGSMSALYLQVTSAFDIMLTRVHWFVC